MRAYSVPSSIISGLCLLSLVACNKDASTDDTDDTGDTSPPVTDADGDGVAAQDDCDDNNADLGSTQADQDCDGVLTEDDCDDTDPSANLTDNDSDGFSTCTGDCDDSDPNQHPDAEDGFTYDANCDGSITNRSLASALTIQTDDGNQSLGHGITNMGDWNGDGADDILMADPWATHAGEGNGTVYLFSGMDLATGTASVADAILSFSGTQLNERLGQGISPGGDVDGDGSIDLMIGARNNSLGGGTAGGIAYLFYGDETQSGLGQDPTTAPVQFIGDTHQYYAGYSTNISGDVDGDGLNDVLIGETQASDGENHWSEGEEWMGQVWLVRGTSIGETGSFVREDSDLLIRSNATQEKLGSRIRLGDFDGDGMDDALLGAPRAHEKEGASYLLSATDLANSGMLLADEASYVFEGAPGAQNWIGSEIAFLSDMDGDGRPEIGFGSTNNDTGADGGGAVFVLLSSSVEGPGTYSAISNADFHIYNSRPKTYFGSDLVDLGDFDGDGVGDFFTSGYGYRETEEDRLGATYVVSGADLLEDRYHSEDVARMTWIGHELDGITGGTLSTADLNGNGRMDFVIGSYKRDDDEWLGNPLIVLSGD